MDCYDWIGCLDDCELCSIHAYFMLPACDDSSYAIVLSFAENLIVIDPMPNTPEGIALDWVCEELVKYEAGIKE